MLLLHGGGTHCGGGGFWVLPHHTDLGQVSHALTEPQACLWNKGLDSDFQTHSQLCYKVPHWLLSNSLLLSPLQYPHPFLPDAHRHPSFICTPSTPGPMF